MNSNGHGPRIEPCGTPHLIGSVLLLDCLPSYVLNDYVLAPVSQITLKETLQIKSIKLPD